MKLQFQYQKNWFSELTLTKISSEQNNDDDDDDDELFGFTALKSETSTLLLLAWRWIMYVLLLKSRLLPEQVCISWKEEINWASDSFVVAAFSVWRWTQRFTVKPVFSEFKQSLCSQINEPQSRDLNQTQDSHTWPGGLWRMKMIHLPLNTRTEGVKLYAETHLRGIIHRLHPRVYFMGLSLL